ncbi:DUF1345 domain-containing protein [Stagnihabitans tardus]|uniref:DUF1345 domain-containing protein n=1 Tax=Stagnihabitans tardus TaxID=2699202 RepID=A0AAE5BVH5_9RHOB|nr:DUF1345 domain-containing protein [Stagnihabitans tardus]NBZ88237.1 DUF1345 domain-containing protein [Stagnihabitans tardus]
MRLWRKHKRFLLALALGLAIWAAGFGLAPEMRALAGVNGFFFTYLLLVALMGRSLTPEALRAHAEIEDEGAALILILALLGVGVSLSAVFLVLNRESSLPEALFALAAAPLGWATLQVMAAFRYAHLWFAAEPEGGLVFPGETPPDIWDFFYFALTVGMTFQVSDVVVTSPRLRRMVMLHGLGSFFFNTVILALAVNAALALSR